MTTTNVASRLIDGIADASTSTFAAARRLLAGTWR